MKILQLLLRRYVKYASIHMKMCIIHQHGRFTQNQLRGHIIYQDDFLKCKRDIYTFGHYRTAL